MKIKSLVIFLFATFSGQLIYAQSDSIFVNFDNVVKTFSAFGTTFSKVANPSATGINTSAYVGQVISSSASTWEGIYNTINVPKFDFSKKHTFKMKVFAPRVADILMKLENSANSAQAISLDVYTTKVGEWEELTFDFPAAASNLYDRITLMFDFNAVNNGEKWYFDDLVFVLPHSTNNISISNVFSSNMVLQQNMQVALWGWGPANQNVEITGSWGQSVTVKTGADFKWKTNLQTPKAVAGEAPAYTLTFKGLNNTVTLNNILIGDVWLCAGQSNMEFTMTPNLPWTAGVTSYQTEISAASFPNIRLFKVPRKAQPTIADNCSGAWMVCNPANIAQFSAIAYYFGRELYQNSNINIPIGLIESAYGGSSCEAWTRREALAGNADLKKTYLDSYDANPLKGDEQTRSTNLYNAMIAPIVSYGIKGAIWYQGENNALDGPRYGNLCSTMVNDWRSGWGCGNFPFYYTQLPAYLPTVSAADTTWASFREVQTNMLTLENTGMAVTLELGDLYNIHPIKKFDVGKRLALWALAKTYNLNYIYSGPIYKSSTVESNKIRISFHPFTLGSGLVSRGGGTLTEFQIAGADKKLYPANAVIDGNSVVVSSASVPNPTIVWFGFSNGSIPNLMNAEGLPAAPFRTNRWNNNIDISSVYPVSVNKMNSGFDTIYPNPVDQMLFISASNTIKSIELIDISGYKLHINATKNGTKAEINTSYLKSGVYILLIKQNDGNEICRKIIKN